MPFFYLTTNVKLEVADSKALVTALLEKLADVYQMPVNVMTASYTYNETLAVKGTFEPSFTGTFESIIKISHEENDGNAAQLSDFLSDKLRVPQDRGFITFVLHPTENLANGGKTMATILGKK